MDNDIDMDVVMGSEQSSEKDEHIKGIDTDASPEIVGDVYNILGEDYMQDIEELKQIRVKSLKPNKEIWRKNRILIHSDSESVSMAYKVLRTKVYKKLKENNWSSFGVSSANPSEGKSTTSINLAYTLEQSIELPVVLVDLDMHRPNVHKLLAMEPTHGIVNYLRDEVSLVDIIYRLKDTNLLIVPGKSPADDGSRLLVSERMKNFTKDITDVIGSCIVIFDMAPVLAVDDVITFEGKDCNLIITAESTTQTDQISTVMDLLEEQNILGYVLNKSKNSSHRSKYGYYSYYGYNYSDYSSQKSL